ncbi:heparan-alpha-glucosaminide N-acetyltransferase domain-containing protein [Pontimicrobium sp. MEBiC06410]
METKRLYFIDAVRAFAILMMLQGHFIDTLLNPIYRDTTNNIYNIWSYFRGITAPTFFTISGLVFIYLLLKAKIKGNERKRIKKGIIRGIMLILIGYALRANIFQLISGYFSPNFLAVDVLQCIGLSLLLLIFLYSIFKKSYHILGIVLFIIGNLCFVTEPFYRTLNVEKLPTFLENYITTANGSVFTILPWFGFSAFGGCIATLFFSLEHKPKFKPFTIIAFFVYGFFLIYYSSTFLIKLYNLTNIELLKSSASYNYLFTRLGNVLIIFGIFYCLERFSKKSIIIKIGEKTLSIYTIHFAIIFGALTGYGLKHFFYKALTPYQAIVGALLFVIIVCLISFHYVKTNAFIYNKIRKLYLKNKTA